MSVLKGKPFAAFSTSRRYRKHDVGADTAPAKELAKAIGEALTATKPKARYLAGKGAREAVALARTPSDRLKDLAIVKETALPDPD